MSFLKDMFVDKLVTEDREPSWTFEISGIDGQFGVLLPKYEYWKQLIVIFLIDQTVNILLGTIMYFFIIKQRGTTASYLVGYGFILPAITMIPYYIIDYLQLENVVLKMTASIVFSTISFKCFEAMYDTTQPGAEHSLVNYITYCHSHIPCVWDAKAKSRVRLTPIEFAINTNRLVWHYTFYSVLVSYMLAYDFKPFPSDVILDKYHLSWDLLKPAHIVNNYILALTVFFWLSAGFNTGGFFHNLQGWKTPDIFRNPFFTSKSISDLWSKRWNSAVQISLKSGVFLPVRKYFSSDVALVCTFIASGLLHDIVWCMTFYEATGKDQTFSPIFLKQVAFFLWSALMMLLERPAGKLPIFQWISKNLPRPIVSTMVVLLAIPIAHWFGGDWAIGKLFHHHSLGVFLIVKL
mmetsp:Transcript_26717/g.37657  ORF Transcript_26717/g.37657 Transcript_26717/m.37657 type:complete len:407 (-) Transcript_26717:1300-2520(-)